ncbi:MAG: PaaI family thioesterase [Dehalococcoidia bacterium]|nr:PaaI family thioesterase [Dehalococcoidia bacterium]
MAASKERALLRVLGIVAHDLGEGWCEYRIAATPASSDGRGSVSSFATIVAADMGVLVAATSTVDTDIEENSGTAELNMTYIEQPEGDLVVRAEVAGVARTMRVVIVNVRDARGVLVAEGRGTYAVRQKSQAAQTPQASPAPTSRSAQASHASRPA